MHPTDVVRSLYESFARKDAEALRALLHPDVEWIQCNGFPGGDYRRGAEEVIKKVFGGLRSAWDDFEASVEEYLDAGSQVVALGRYVGVHVGTRRSMTAIFAHVYDVQDSRIVRFRQFADTWPMIAAIRGEDVSCE